MEQKYKVGEVLISGAAIGKRVSELAVQVASDIRGKELLVVGILNGAVFFLSDLVRRMPEDLDVRVDFMSVSSYENATKSSGVVITFEGTPSEGAMAEFHTHWNKIGRAHV